MELFQGTDEWLKTRAKRLGGSEIASVLRISPYKTRLELWEEKTGRREQPNISHLPHVKRGIDAEPIARGLLERKYRVKYTTPVLTDKEFPWMAASLDGICNEHTLEIKTMGREKHLDVKDGIVPDYYACQVQWGLMISNKPFGIFASYRPEDGTLYEVDVHRDEVAIQEMRQKAIEFWDWVVNDRRPPDDYTFNFDNK
jgi:putative phage-type endonuclease